jgi:O-antigen ligase
VSAILGLGAFAAFLYIILEDKNRFLRFLFVLISIWLFAQSALTFSRGGFWNGLIAVMVAVLYLAQNKRIRNTLLGASVVGLIIINYIVLPTLDQFTSGALVTRFSDISTTGRLEIAQADLKIFTQYPLFGVGPGQSKPYHALFFRSSAAHTEYSRMLSEHGSFGAMALIIMVWMATSRITAKTHPLSKAFAIAFLVWALVLMTHAATRLVAPSFLFGLAFAKFDIHESQGKENVLSN